MIFRLPLSFLLPLPTPLRLLLHLLLLLIVTLLLLGYSQFSNRVPTSFCFLEASGHCPTLNFPTRKLRNENDFEMNELFTLLGFPFPNM